MNKKTLTALKGSIKKWEKIVDGTGKDNGTDNCPLCAIFTNIHDAYACTGCPVDDASEDSCNCTPYDSWADHQTITHHMKIQPYFVQCDECKELAQAELDFLKSLLPEGK